MKKIKVALFAFVLGSLALTSCSSDSNGTSTPATVIGKWNPTTTKIKIGSNAESDNPYTQTVNGCTNDYIQFVEAGNVFNRILHSKNPDTGACQESPATPTTWAKNNDKLTIDGGQYGGQYDITELTASNLRLQKSVTDVGITTVTTIYFTKAAN